MYVCVCVCVGVRGCVYIYTTSARRCCQKPAQDVWICDMCVCMFAINIIYVCMYVHMYVCMCACLCVYSCMYASVPIFIHTLTYMHTHTYITQKTLLAGNNTVRTPARVMSKIAYIKTL
jgi:hypothetical protein